MKRLAYSIILYVLAINLSLGNYCYSADSEAKPSNSMTNLQQQKKSTPFPSRGWMQKIIKRHELEDEGWVLAKKGLYDEAILKFRAATDPFLLNNKGDKSVALHAICTIYKYQGKLDEALELYEKSIIPMNPKKEEFINKHIELRALIKARDTKNIKPIYDYINYLKTKDRAEGYAPDSHVDDLIHLYDYLHDYDSGIAFMDEIIKYHTQHKNAAHRSANAKHVQEYTRVKQAWELDKKTGQHGHLQEVIKTSDMISW